MYSVKQNGPAGTENAEKQCRLCLKQSREYYSLKKRFEDTPPVHEVIKTLLSFVSTACWLFFLRGWCGVKWALKGF